MIGFVNNKAPTLGLAHDFKRVQCKLKSKLKRMLVKEWS